MAGLLRIWRAFVTIVVGIAVTGTWGCGPTEAELGARPEEIRTTTADLAPTGFEEVAVLTGLTQPTVVRFAPDGKVFVAQKDGRIFVYDSIDDTSATLFADLRPQVYNFWD